MNSCLSSASRPVVLHVYGWRVWSPPEKLLGGEQATEERPEETDTLLAKGEMVAAQVTEPSGQVPLNLGCRTSK